MAISVAQTEIMKRKILMYSVVAAIVVLIAGIALGLAIIKKDPRLPEKQRDDAYGYQIRAVIIDAIVLAVLVMLFPYGAYTQKVNSQVIGIEERLPEFLRDVAEAGRFGMTLADAIMTAAAGRYGPLTDEIKKMSAQIEWGVPATEALTLFSKRVDTPMVNRLVAVIIKASEAGGNVADVLTMVSRDAKELLLTKHETQIAMSTYLVVIYIAFGVFLFTIYILNSVFLPQMKQAGTGVAEAIAKTGQSVPSNLQINVGVIVELAFVFIVAIIAHAIGDGLMAGVLYGGKVTLGFLHSGIMLASGYFFLRLTSPI
ncbi:MAG TPA: type II secretion system F family protein [Thermoplasmata archaeon]|nr:type II secretion system F family protein [Thermoplasmata archaeon]